MTKSNKVNHALIIEKNLRAFKEKLPELIEKHQGKFVLMHQEDVAGIYDTVRDAKITGEKFYPNGDFSIQQVLSRPINLGYFSYAHNLSAAQ